MTDLTEQWKKGELPEGHYYVKDGENMIAEYLDGYFYKDGQPMTSFSGGVDKVLAPVPTFEEWQASEKYNKHLEEIIKIYEQKDKQATETSIAYNELLEENAKLKSEYKAECKRADELEDSYWKSEKENQKLKEEVSRESYKVSEAYCLVEELKELLKECKPYINHSAIRNRFRNSAGNKKDMKLLTKIDEVI